MFASCHAHNPNPRVAHIKPGGAVPRFGKHGLIRLLHRRPVFIAVKKARARQLEFAFRGAYRFSWFLPPPVLIPRVELRQRRYPVH